MERFARLNICGFSLTKVFVGILLQCLGQKCLIFSIINERCLYSGVYFIMSCVHSAMCALVAAFIAFTNLGKNYITPENQ